MPIKKMEDGRYEIRYDTYDASGNRKQHKKIMAGLKDAKAFEAKHTLNPFDESKATVKEFFDGWLAHVKSHRKQLTHDNYKQQIDLFYSILEANYTEWAINPAKFRIAKLKRSHFQAVFDWMIIQTVESGKNKGQLRYSHGSLQTMRSTLSSAFSYALSDPDNPIVSANPLTHTILGGKAAREHQVLDSDQVDTLLAFLKQNETMYMPVFLAVTLGLCRGEVNGLKWSHVNLDTGILNVVDNREYSRSVGIYEDTPKTKRRRRTLSLPLFIIDELRREKARQLEYQLLFGPRYKKSDYVCRQNDGSLYSPITLSRDFPAYSVRAGLPRVTFHELRHSAASVMIAHGVPITVVSDILGHSNTRITTEVYAHALVNGKDEAAKTLDKIYGPKTDCVENVSNGVQNARKPSK